MMRGALETRISKGVMYVDVVSYRITWIYLRFRVSGFLKSRRSNCEVFGRVLLFWTRLAPRAVK